MIVKNMTDKEIQVNLREIMGERDEYSIFIRALATTEIDDLVTIANREELGNRIHICSEETTPVVHPVVETTIVEDKIEETPVEENNEEPVVEHLEEQFICTECGAEFASARGLASHMTRAHNH